MMWLLSLEMSRQEQSVSEQDVKIRVERAIEEAEKWSIEICKLCTWSAV